jgi:hypothetical protein
VKPHTHGSDLRSSKFREWLNGHEWAKRRARAAGIAFTELDNGFATVEDPARLQAIDHLTQEAGFAA